MSEWISFHYIKVKQVLTQFLSNRFLVLFILVFIIKLILTIFGPFFSSDYERNLFYGKAFFEHGFYVYNLTPLEIDPTYSVGDPTMGTLSYPLTTYDYPVIQLLFWAVVSLFPFVVGKIILTMVDAINFFLIRDLLKNASRAERELVSWSYFIFVSIFSSIDGQPEVITLLFMLAIIKYTQKKPVIAFFLCSLGFLWKYIPGIMLLYLLVIYRRDLKMVFQGLITFFGSILVLSIVPILTSAYIFRYVSYFGNLPFNQISSNPMAWKYTYLSSILLWALLLYILYYLWNHPSEIQDFLILLPVLLFLKYYQFAFPWYWVWILPGVIAIKKDKTRVIIWRFLIVLLPIAVIDFINLTVGFGYVSSFLFGS